MPTLMPIEAAWEKLVTERVNTALDVVVLTKHDIESTTGNELRLMTKLDSSAVLPKALRRHGYFVLPIKNGEYVLVRGNGYHALEKLPQPPTVFKPKLDFELKTLDVGDSESQHLDYSYNVGLIERFAGLAGLRQTIRGRKRMPAIDFRVGQIGPINVNRGVQIEVDLGCEGVSDVVLMEAKTGEPEDFIIRQLFYPYRKWKHEIPGKRIRPWFFCSKSLGNRRFYSFWEYEFTDDLQYQSLSLRRNEAFLVEPSRRRLTVDELLRAHVTIRAKPDFWNVPQADSFERVAEMPLLIAQGLNTSQKVATHYNFDPRQSSYYRQAAEFLGLVSQDEKGHEYILTDLGREYADLPADERRQLLAGILAHFPPMRATLEASGRAGARGVSRMEIAELIECNSKIKATTPNRRASTLMAWLRWLQSNTGAVQTTLTGDGFSAT